MATWVCHFRIAQHFLDRIDDLSSHEFIVGNIGPDSGEPNEDWSQFSPSTELTHWRDAKNGNEIDGEAFYRRYLPVGAGLVIAYQY